jgi:hypothetical protein
VAQLWIVRQQASARENSMKKCSYCGAEYPDDLTVCPVDKTPFEKDCHLIVGAESKAMLNKRTIPAGLAVVSYLFLATSVLILAWNAFLLHLGAPIQLNVFVGVLAIFISVGLRRCSRGWRICALATIWWTFIALAWKAYDLLSRYFQAITHKPVDEHPVGLYVTPADKLPVGFLVILAVFFLIQIWQYRVLTRPEVRELFYSEP